MTSHAVFGGFVGEFQGLERIARQQLGVFSRPQALERGLTEGQVDRRVVTAELETLAGALSRRSQPDVVV